jgi:hypothetical protein
MVADLEGPQADEPRVELVWRWCRWTRWPLDRTILVVAALTISFDVVTAWLGVNLGTLGRVPISPTLGLELLLVILVGWRRLGLDRTNLDAWREFLAVSGAALLFGVIQYSKYIGGFAEAMGLVVAAFDEEIVYRLAVLIVVGATMARLSGRNWRNAEDWGIGPGLVAIVASGVVFTAVVVHALLNLATIAAFTGEMSLAVRTTLSAAVLVALVLGTVVAGRRLGILRQVPVGERIPIDA